MSKGTQVGAEAPAPQVVRDVLTAIAREGARKMLATALEDEVTAYIAAAAIALHVTGYPAISGPASFGIAERGTGATGRDTKRDARTAVATA